MILLARTFFRACIVVTFWSLHVMNAVFVNSIFLTSARTPFALVPPARPSISYFFRFWVNFVRFWDKPSRPSGFWIKRWSSYTMICNSKQSAISPSRHFWGKNPPIFCIFCPSLVFDQSSNHSFHCYSLCISSSSTNLWLPFL